MQPRLSRCDHLPGVQAAGGGQHHQVHRCAAALGGFEQIAVGVEGLRLGGSARMLQCRFSDQLLRFLQALRLRVADGGELRLCVMLGDGADVVGADASASHQGDADGAAGDCGDGVEHL